MDIRQLLSSFSALALGQDIVVWVDQSDMAANSDQNHIYLPTPQGISGESVLLLALFFRELGRLKFTEPAQVDADERVTALAYAIEEARVKQAIMAEYKGVAEFFESATSVMADMLTPSDIDPHLAVWFAANDGLLGTTTSGELASHFAEALAYDSLAVTKAMTMASTAPWLASTRSVANCAAKIAGLLPMEMPPEPAQKDGHDPADGDQSGSGDASAEDTKGPPSDSQANNGDGQGDPQGSNDDQDTGQQNSDQGGHGTDDAPSDGKPTADPMSDALAKLKGHPQSVKRDAGSPMDMPADASSDVHPSDAIQAQSTLQDLLDQMAKLAAAYAQASESQRPTVEENSVGSENDPPPCGSSARSSNVDADLFANQPGLTPTPAGHAVSGSVNDGQSDESFELTLLAGQEGGRLISHVKEDPADRLLGTVPSQMVSALLRAIQDRRHVHTRCVESGSRVNVARFWRLKAMGDTRVMSARRETGGIDAAVWILLDVSKSMRDRIEVAVNATHAFMVGLQRVGGIQSALSVFPGRTGACEQLVGLNQNLTTALASMRSITAYGSLTPMGEAIFSVTEPLARAHKKRKMLIVITDGKPSGGRRLVDIAREQARLNGVETFCVGIQEDVSELFSNASVSIQHVNDLPGALQHLFKRDVLTPEMA